MKAAALFGKESLNIIDAPVPEIGHGDVLVRIKSAFVCGTDVRFYFNGKPDVDAGHPRILGHEFAGIIEKIGKDVKGYVPGQPVAIAPIYGCGVCDVCVSGHSEMCVASEALGITIDGGFSEFVKIPEQAVRQGNISLIPDGVSFSEAALAEPLSCVYNAYEKIGIYPGDTVVVIGSGPIGIMHCLVALMAGACKVYISDISEQRMDLACNIDSRIQKLPAGQQLLPELKRVTNGRLANLVITAASVGAIQEQAFSLVGQNGRVMFFGGLPSGKSTVSLDTNEIHYKQLLVAGTTRQSLRQYRKCLDLIAGNAINVKAIITAESPVEDVVQAIMEAKGGIGLKRAIVF